MSQTQPEPSLPLYQVSFENEKYAPVSLQANANLSEHLDVQNSPILFGCRTGICGTCLIEVLEETEGCLSSRNETEENLLEILAPEFPQARLACQIELSANIKIRPLKQ